VIGVRGDIDALPMTELNDVPYKSINPGAMHSCGHDCHGTMVLGVAKKLVESGLARKLKGGVKFILQPAEEVVGGAKSMIESGVLRNPPLDRILAGPMFVDLPAGQVGFFKENSHAAADTFKLTLLGKGAHGAHPHDGLDPVVAGAHLVTAFQSIVGRNVDPTESAVITVGQLTAGTAPNIIPDRLFLSGTVRTFKPHIRDLVKARLLELVEATAKGFRMEVDYQFIDGVPACIVDPKVTEEVFQAAVKVLGEANVHWLKPKMGGEDFAYFTQAVPGTFMRVGCGNPAKGIKGRAHSPHFDVDETALAVGVEVFIEAIKTYLG
ncbi:partial amidohydrolase, partial [Anaerolineae bacterium]